MGWIQHLRNWKVIRKAEQNERLKFLHIDIGQTGMWGVPIDEEKRVFIPTILRKYLQILEKILIFALLMEDFV